MGILRDRDAWAALSSKPKAWHEVVAALGQRVAEEEYDLGLLGWFTDGRSDAPVARVIRHIPGDAVQLVLKFSSTFDRIKNLRRGWNASAGFREEHLAQTEDQTLVLGDSWRAAFMHVAGGNLNQFRALNADLETGQFPATCGTVIRSIVNEWNKGKADHESTTIGQYVDEVVGRRRVLAEEWASSVGVAVDGSADPIDLEGWPEPLPNPFQLLSGAEAGLVVDDKIIGLAHGDLSGRNILLGKEPESFVLIDYDRFSERAPLARDPMHLLVALALDDFDNNVTPHRRAALARVLVDPDAEGVPGPLDYFRKISRAVHENSVALARSRGRGGPWTEQCLLSLAGAGIVHLGRDLRRGSPEKDDEAKNWCLQVAAVATERYLRTAQRSQTSPGRGATAPPEPGLPEPPGHLVNRTNELRELKVRLSTNGRGVVVVRGARGVGKSRLVAAALKDIAAAARLHQHEVTANGRFDARTLADYLAADEQPPSVRYGGSSLVRLERALRQLGDTRVVVTVDSAENLFDEDTRRLADPDLDEALEMLATEPGHRVTVLLVTHKPPAPYGDNGTWSEAEPQICVDKLEKPHFFQYLGSLDRNGRTRSSLLRDDEQRDHLYRRLQGNPWLANLVYFLIGITGKYKLLRLADHLLEIDQRDVPARLIGLLIDKMDPLHRRVLQALAAFDTPVSALAVSALATTAFPCPDEAPDDIAEALEFLMTENVIRCIAATGEYFIPSAEGHSVISRTVDPVDRPTLHLLAATELTSLRNPHPRGISDLRIHLAELRAMMKAGDPDAAYGMLDALDDVLREWNCEDLLLPERLTLRGKLRNPRYKMSNHNDLGGIYLARREFDLADKEFGAALGIANALNDEASKIDIWPNLAGFYWEVNDTDRAQGYYETALRDAERRGRPVTQMLALEGVADCQRRRGRYTRATAHADRALCMAREALVVPDASGFPDTDRARYRATSVGVAVALKLARWYAERNDLETAAIKVQQGKELAEQRSDDWLRASCADGQADLAFNGGDFTTAESYAGIAVEQALALNDPITLLQARTTLCLVHLKGDRFRAARHEIERAGRYRYASAGVRRQRLDRSLLVLALLGLTARLDDDPGTADMWFDRLEDEARTRIDRDADDFAAWDFLGYAICGSRINSKAGLDEAITAVREGRRRSEPTPVLVDRLRFLFESLDRRARTTGRLNPVMEALDSPGRAEG
jgi:tetratricopeptide (TPR) repeat protein